MNSLDELLERVKAASGPVTIEPKAAYRAMAAMGSDTALGDASTLRKALSGSLDAALALVEQVLPGCGIKLHIENGRGLYGAVATILEPPTKWGEYQHEEFGKTPTLALLAALLSALIARDGAGYGTASTPGNSGRAPKPQDLSARDQ